MASFKLHDSNITATVNASAKISASDNTTATITVTATGSIPNGYNVYSTGVVAAITINGSSSGNKTIFGNASGWYYGSEGAKSVTYSVTVNKSTAAQSISWSVAFKNAIDGTIIATKHTATGTVSVPAKPSYTVAYNANGGSGAPSSQTKWYGTALTLSSNKPTRTGYSFQGWATSASGSVAYASGASYTANAGVTLYAKWKANTYTVSYNANGGTGAPGSQTKTYGVTLTLSSTKPTRANYTFLGWATSSSATTAAYKAGAIYTENAAVTLYAVWQLAYTKPRIFNLTVSRCDSSGAEDDTGSFARVKFEYACDQAVDTTSIEWESATGDSGIAEDVMDGDYGGNVDHVIDYVFSAETTYTFTVTIVDTQGSTSASVTMGGSKFPIDAKAGGDGVAFGKPAELGAAESLSGAGVADFAYEAKFNEPVYGKALGMDRLPAIPANSDFNNYMEPGCYAVQSNAIAETCTNIPVARAGRLEVWSATGEGVRLEQWSYLRQRFIPYNSSNAVWERELTRGENNVWNYYDWWRSSLTPAASAKVYNRAAISVALSNNTTLGVVNSYTQIPFAITKMNVGGRLALSNNAVQILTSDVEYVKASGQVLVKCGPTDGNRHVRIQRVRSDGTISLTWVCVYGTADANVVYPVMPIVFPVAAGDRIQMVYYTSDAADSLASGSGANGTQTYLTVEEL